MTLETHTIRPKAPWHLWVVGIVAALWSALGALDFTATVTHFEPYMANFPQELLDYWYGFPIWMFVIWGGATFAGLAGAILLLLRLKLAAPLFWISLVCAVISGVVSVLRPPPAGGGDPVFAVAIIVFAALFPLYALWQSRRGVLR